MKYMSGNVIPQGFKLTKKPFLGDADPLLDQAWQLKLDTRSSELVEIMVQIVELSVECLTSKWSELEAKFNNLDSTQNEKQEMA